MSELIEYKPGTRFPSQRQTRQKVKEEGNNDKPKIIN